MTISSPEREAKKVKIAVDRNPVETNFEKWACGLKKELDIWNNYNLNSSFVNTYLAFYYLYIFYFYLKENTNKVRNINHLSWLT